MSTYTEAQRRKIMAQHEAAVGKPSPAVCATSLDKPTPWDQAAAAARQWMKTNPSANAYPRRSIPDKRG
jgi:hypothetical protein